MIICPSARGILRPQVGASGVTWNPADAGSGVALSNGNLTATATTSSSQVRATISASTGKKYWEVRLDIGPTSSNPYVGVRPIGNAFALGQGPFASGGDIGCFARSPNDGHEDYVPGSNVAAIGPALSSGDVYMLALDFTGGKLWVGRNGTWDSGGNPATNAGGMGLSTGTYAAWASCSSVTLTAHFAASDFVYSAPSGFSPW